MLFALAFSLCAALGEIQADEFATELPTFHCLGYRWLVTGDRAAAEELWAALPGPRKLYGALCLRGLIPEPQLIVLPAERAAGAPADTEL